MAKGTRFQPYKEEIKIGTWNLNDFTVSKLKKIEKNTKSEFEKYLVSLVKDCDFLVLTELSTNCDHYFESLIQINKLEYHFVSHPIRYSKDNVDCDNVCKYEHVGVFFKAIYQERDYTEIIDHTTKGHDMILSKEKLINSSIGFPFFFSLKKEPEKKVNIGAFHYPASPNLKAQLMLDNVRGFFTSYSEFIYYDDVDKVCGGITMKKVRCKLSANENGFCHLHSQQKGKVKVEKLNTANPPKLEGAPTFLVGDFNHATAPKDFDVALTKGSTKVILLSPNLLDNIFYGFVGECSGEIKSSKQCILTGPTYSDHYPITVSFTVQVNKMENTYLEDVKYENVLEVLQFKRFKISPEEYNKLCEMNDTEVKELGQEKVIQLNNLSVTKINELLEEYEIDINLKSNFNKKEKISLIVEYLSNNGILERDSEKEEYDKLNLEELKKIAMDNCITLSRYDKKSIIEELLDCFYSNLDNTR